MAELGKFIIISIYISIPSISPYDYFLKTFLWWLSLTASISNSTSLATNHSGSAISHLLFSLSRLLIKLVKIGRLIAYLIDDSGLIF